MTGTTWVWMATIEVVDDDDQEVSRQLVVVDAVAVQRSEFLDLFEPVIIRSTTL